MTTINEKVYLVLTKPEFWLIVGILVVLAGGIGMDIGIRSSAFVLQWNYD